jgi:hypothetical protein
MGIKFKAGAVEVSAARGWLRLPLACSNGIDCWKIDVLSGGWPSAGERTVGTAGPLARTGDEIGPAVLAFVLNR